MLEYGRVSFEEVLILQGAVAQAGSGTRLPWRYCARAPLQCSLV